MLDITIIKPVIESCIGEDLITGEDLTDMERGLKVVFAMVDLVTLGGAIAATKFSEMGLKEGLKAFGKTALIDFAGNTAACGVGALGETFDWPVPITMMLSLAAGITVSISGNKLLFKNADGIEIGSKTLSDADLKIVEQTIEGENYSNLTEVVSAKEAEVYLHFLESGSTEGMTESELKAVQKIEELIKSNKIDYDGILKIRNETVKSDVEVVRKTTEDSVEDVGKNAAEDAGKVVESGTSSELKVIGTYDNNNYFTRAVEFNAGSEGTGFTYKVYQRNDIDWNIVRTTGQRKEEVCLTHKPLKSMIWHLFLMMVMLPHCIIHNREVLDHCLKLLHVIIIFPMLKKDRSIHIKVNLIRLTRWIVIQEVYSKKWILLNIGKQEEEML